ncbi:MAG TPA: hypothetical protein GX714_11185 [Chloroflexi bacterium]|nr:hypothetical protein [Chloroflexota bacterium]
MAANDLTDYAFGEWLPFTEENERALLDALPRSTGVVAIRRTFEGDREPEMVCVAVGANHSGGVQMRVRQMLHPGRTQSTNLRIRAALEQEDDLELAWALRANEAACKELRAKLVNQYEREYGHPLELCPGS